MTESAESAPRGPRPVSKHLPVGMLIIGTANWINTQYIGCPHELSGHVLRTIVKTNPQNTYLS